MYSKTVAGRRSNRKPLTNIQRKNLFVADKILEEIWEKPLQIGRGILPYGEIKKKFDEIVKPSAMHTKEGHLFEAKAVVWNNPFKPLEVSDWGELNNIGGGGVNILSGNKATRVNARTTREARFTTALHAEEERCIQAIARAVHGGRPPPPPNATQTVRKAYWGKRVLDYENTDRGAYNARPDGKPTWDTDANRRTIGPATKGNRYMPLIFKNQRAYFISPKFSTVELRPHPVLFDKGKGKQYIELDGLIHFILPNGTHKFIVLELKKQQGATGFKDAQQMRKAAALLRKWGYELTGRTPIVELYFAAQAADQFAETAEGYEYQSEEGPVQDWTQAKINQVVAAAPDHLAYIKTPIMLLTGMGLADLLRMDHWRMAKIRETLAEAQDLGDAVATYFKGKTYINFKKYLIHKPPRGEWTPVTNVELKKPGVILYIDIGRMAREDRGFRAAIPAHWRPDPTKIHPSAGLARVAEGLVYINALKRKMTANGVSNNKKAELKKALVAHLKYLLSPKYRPYIKNNKMRELRADLTALEGRIAAGMRAMRQALGGGSNAASPVRNAKFYSRIFKQTAKQPVTYFKLPANMKNQYPDPGEGEWRTKQFAKFKFGPKKIRGPPVKNNNNNSSPEKNVGVLPEYMFKGVANINFGNEANLTPNKLANVDDFTMARWMRYITERLAARTNLNANTERVYKKLINGAKNVYARPVANLSPKDRLKRNVVKQQVNIANAALTKFLANRAAPPAAPVRHRATPARASASRAAAVSAAAAQRNSNNNNNAPRQRPRARGGGSARRR